MREGDIQTRKAGGGGAGARRHSRRWLPIAGLLLLLAAIIAGLWPKPVPVEYAVVTIGPLQSYVSEEGVTRVRHRFVVSAPVAGQLQRIEYKAGAQVKEGEVVAIIQPLAPALLDERSKNLALARRDTVAAQLEKSRAAAAFAANELKRFEQLHEDGTISVQELETVQLRDASAGKDVAAAESALRQAEAELAEFSLAGSVGSASKPIEVRAPAAGSILRVLEENARTVAPGMPLLEVGDIADLEVVIDVLSRDGAAIGAGTRVLLEQWGGPKPLEARVRLVEPAAFTKVSALGVEEQRVNVVADLVTPAEQRRNLGDNFRVEAKIIVWEEEKTLKVPAGALFRSGSEWAVFVVKDSQAHRKVVRVGRSSGSETQVVDGLKEGEEVILYPGRRISENTQVRRITI